jgi:uncharacterized protein (DUF2062 family)
MSHVNPLTFVAGTLSRLKVRVYGLLKSDSLPHQIAMGVAIGVFIGITPFYGFHIMMALITAFTLKRVNKVAIFLGINISLPPTIPFITWAGYTIGRLILGGGVNYPPLGWDAFREVTQTTIARFLYALVVGSTVLGIVVSSVVYCLVVWFLEKRKAGRLMNE